MLLRENDKDFREVNKFLGSIDPTITQKRAVCNSLIGRPSSAAVRQTTSRCAPSLHQKQRMSMALIQTLIPKFSAPELKVAE